MTDQTVLDNVWAICTDGPCEGIVFEIPRNRSTQVLVWGHHYRVFTLVNGVAHYRYVAP